MRRFTIFVFAGIGALATCGICVSAARDMNSKKAAQEATANSETTSVVSEPTVAEPASKKSTAATKKILKEVYAEAEDLIRIGLGPMKRARRLFETQPQLCGKLMHGRGTGTVLRQEALRERVGGITDIDKLQQIGLGVMATEIALCVVCTDGAEAYCESAKDNLQDLRAGRLIKDLRQSD